MSSSSKNEIPDFPGFSKTQSKSTTPHKPSTGTQKIPNRPPPGYFDDQQKMPKLRMIKKGNNAPIHTKQSMNTPPKDYYTAPPKFVPDPASGRRVDSKMQSKSSGSFSPNSAMSPPPQFIGSTYVNTPNASVRPVNVKPLSPTVPRAYGVPTVEDYQDQPLLKARSPSGKILGSYRQDVVNEVNVPFLEPDMPVGPDNPAKEINETWTSCWDDEAGAIYYYNKLSGEATWIAPDF